MAKIKTSRLTPRNNQVIPMPDSSAVALVKKNPPAPSSPPSDLEQEIRQSAPMSFIRSAEHSTARNSSTGCVPRRKCGARHQQRQHRA
jgi:hypothetical protein